MPSLARLVKLALAASLLLTAPLAGNPNAAPQPEGRVLRHVVLFKFKETTPAADKKKIEEAFRALPGKIREIRGFEWGTNVSPENLSQGFTHCFVLTFASAPDRDAYLVHPAHKEFGNILGSALEQALVVDFWAGR
ncbi:MAG TPA: Dabb family protein [Candidatus Acidoferrum sp.]|nr:Dabb family protein [Candidatus Acidoferrum sp.]